MFKQTMFSLALGITLLTGAAVSAQAQSTNTMPAQSGTSNGAMGASTGKDLAASAGMSSDHTTLLQALQAAGLADRAKGAGPYTVFAPTNDAFAKLPAGTLDNLLKPEMKKQLTGILATHVVQGSVKAADLKDGQTIKTVNGETLTVSKQGDTVMIKDAKGGSATVTMADIQATNGVVHSIDTVLMPSK
ncbi:fasciclin domain-containing protein [Fibrisoma montanum]|uniref:Fasciclin domain-containing protein n=1 Tax=Fibrisoma montanum TaxID=2305895 RepID=A0A418MCC6_9BACT|nr:fasciclin domain-containing protein [Fibrisoma montanum]RIV24034.1 fasciclin domain-containing protein [Fibrisoma montanum]